VTPVAWFPDVDIADRPTVGGKGGSLGELTQAGIAVPPGFVVTTSGFELFLTALEAREPVRLKVEALDPNDLGAATKLSEELRRRVIEEPMPAEVEQAIRAAHAELSPNGEPVAVRSSATTEDAEDASFAGLQDTFLWVLGADQMVARVRECWGSLYSVESMTYRRKQDFPEEGVAMAVVVQRMVEARCAGVMFTRSPLTGDKSVITIEGAWGLGSAVVSGEVTPDRWVLGKITGEISVRDISDKHARQVPAPSGGIQEVENEADMRKAPCLTDNQLLALREVGRRIERHYGKPQDIEWALAHDGNVLLLQSRPETVWSAKDAAPIAPVAANPLSHVMNIFGGRK
jgi:pyruvate, water dikinase